MSTRLGLFYANRLGIWIHCVNSLEFMHVVMWYKVFLFNSNNLQKSTGPIDRTRTSISTLGQSEPRSNGTEGSLHTLQTYRSRTSPPDAIKY